MIKKNLETLSTKAAEVYRQLLRQHPNVRIELDYSTTLDLLVSTILSAQCTDVRVNMVTKQLFRKYRTPRDYLRPPVQELEKSIRSTGFFRQKAKSIRGAMARIIDEFGGKVPKTMDELTSLPGVGRKTANVILGNAFGIPGLPVDTHVTRLSNRIGLTKERNPVKIELALNQLLPPRHWTTFSHLLIFHGRRVCKARRPLCSQCSIESLCTFVEKRSFNMGNELRGLTRIHHIAITVADLSKAVSWYRTSFGCEEIYRDSFQAVLQFANTCLVLVLPSYDQPHVAFEKDNAAEFGELREQPSGEWSTALADPTGNMVELVRERETC